MAQDFKDSQLAIDQAVNAALLQQEIKQEIKQVKEHQVDQDKKLEALEKDRDRALRWGIMVLGSAVLSMAGWVAKYFEKLGGA